MKRFFILLLILFYPFALHAEQKSLHIAISTGYPPFYFFNEKEEPTGICIDIIHQVAKAMNLDVQFSSFPWKRMIHNGKEGSVDAIMPLFKTAERETFLHYPANHLILEDNSFYTLQSSPLRYSGKLDDVLDRYIGVIQGYSYGEEFDNKRFKNKTAVGSDDQLIQLVLNNRVEMAIGNSMVVNYLAAQQNTAGKIKFLLPPVTENPLYIGFSKKLISAEFVEQFSQALEAFKATDDYTKIIELYTKQ